MCIRTLLTLTAVAVLILAIGSVLAMNPRTPRHDRNWKPEYARLPKVSVDGDVVTLAGLRDFSYGPDGTVLDRRYRESAFRLSEVQRVWYGISHFGSWGLAHSFVSFEFADGRYLALSIEARQTVGRDYHPLVGLFGAYELIVVAGTERDVIGLRSHVRGERVYLYPITVPRESVELLLRAMIERIDQIQARPELYHTITDNCAMAIWRYYEEMSAFERFTNPKLLLPGFSDEVALQRGLIAGNGTIEDLRRSALIDPTVVSLDDAAFSARIRGL